MKKFILIGGYPHKAADGGKALCEEMTKGFTEPVKILVCLFARPRENWEEVFEQDKVFFAKNLPHIRMECVMANSNSFIEQLRDTNAVYFRGGDTGVLLRELSRVPSWSNELSGKTIAGSSAGMDMLSIYNYNTDTLRIESGLGLLQIKTIPHWNSDYNAPNVDWGKAKLELTHYREELPVIALKEGEFQVFDVK